MVKIYTEEELLKLERDNLFQIAENFGVKTYNTISNIKLVQSILDAQADALEEEEENPQDHEQLSESVEEVSKNEQETSLEEALQEEEEKQKEDVSGFDKPVIQMDPEQLIFALQKTMSQASNVVQVRKNVREISTEEGKKKFQEMRQEANKAVLVRIFKNNPRIRGERVVTFDVGNAVFTINWTIFLGVPYYIPRMLLPFIKGKKFQRLDIDEDAPQYAHVGNVGTATVKPNFTTGGDDEYNVQILSDEGKTFAQIREEMNARKLARKEAIEHLSEQYGGLSFK